MNNYRHSRDPLFIALILAAIIHGLIIFGLSIRHTQPKPPLPGKKSLSVTLIQKPSKIAPKTAEFLAEENQFGSSTEKLPPKNAELPPPTQPAASHRPLIPDSPKPPAPHHKPITKPAKPHKPEIPHRETIDSPPSKPGTRHHQEPLEAEPKAPERKSKKPSETVATSSRPPKRILTRKHSERKITVEETRESRTPQEQPKLNPLLLSQQISEVSQTINRDLESRSHNPRIMYINSVNAHKYKAAAYEYAWQQKIERIGNLNYPEEARREGLSGSLVLAVWINSDGSLDHIQVRHSSGHPELDHAAENIVRLAAPFASFPAELKEEADKLVITRTWRFYNNYHLETR